MTGAAKRKGDAAEREADDVHYFSNSEDGGQWMRRYCDRCIHDHDFHPGGNEQAPCDHQMALYTHQRSDVFIATPVSVVMASGRTLEVTDWMCVEFARCSCDNGPDDPGVEPPPPVDPNQLTLFDIDAVPAGVPADVYHDTFPMEVAR